MPLAQCDRRIHRRSVRDRHHEGRTALIRSRRNLAYERIPLDHGERGRPLRRVPTGVPGHRVTVREHRSRQLGQYGRVEGEDGGIVPGEYARIQSKHEYQPNSQVLSTGPDPSIYCSSIRPALPELAARADDVPNRYRYPHDVRIVRDETIASPRRHISGQAPLPRAGPTSRVPAVDGGPCGPDPHLRGAARVPAFRKGAAQPGERHCPGRLRCRDHPRHTTVISIADADPSGRSCRLDELGGDHRPMAEAV